MIHFERERANANEDKRMMQVANDELFFSEFAWASLPENGRLKCEQVAL